MELAVRVGGAGDVAGLGRWSKSADLWTSRSDHIESILAGKSSIGLLIFGEEFRGFGLTDWRRSSSVGGQGVARGTLKEQPGETVELVKTFLRATGAVCHPVTGSSPGPSSRP